MSSKVGQKTVETNREQKHELGRSANACANKWLADRRGETVTVYYGSDLICKGTLLEFDLYVMRIRRDRDNREVLVFKGPGVQIDERD